MIEQYDTYDNQRRVSGTAPQCQTDVDHSTEYPGQNYATTLLHDLRLSGREAAQTRIAAIMESWTSPGDGSSCRVRCNFTYDGPLLAA